MTAACQASRPPHSCDARGDGGCGAGVQPIAIVPDAETDRLAAAAGDAFKNVRKYRAVVAHAKGVGPETKSASR